MRDITSCSFSSFRVDWNIFKDMKKDFYKEFLKEGESNLSSLTVSQLRNISKTYKLRGYYKLKKKELVAFILENKN